METRNVTLSLPKDLLYRARRVALDRNTSLSGLMVQALADIVEQEEEYTGAMRRRLEAMGRAPDLGSGGRPGWSREDLHER